MAVTGQPRSSGPEREGPTQQPGTPADDLKTKGPNSAPPTAETRMRAAADGTISGVPSAKNARRVIPASDLPEPVATPAEPTDSPGHGTDEIERRGAPASEALPAPQTATNGATASPVEKASPEEVPATPPPPAVIPGERPVADPPKVEIKNSAAVPPLPTPDAPTITAGVAAVVKPIADEPAAPDAPIERPDVDYIDPPAILKEVTDEPTIMSVDGVRLTDDAPPPAPTEPIPTSPVVDPVKESPTSSPPPAPIIVDLPSGTLDASDNETTSQPTQRYASPTATTRQPEVNDEPRATNGVGAFDTTDSEESSSGSPRTTPVLTASEKRAATWSRDDESLQNALRMSAVVARNVVRASGKLSVFGLTRVAFVAFGSSAAAVDFVTKKHEATDVYEHKKGGLLGILGFKKYSVSIYGTTIKIRASSKEQAQRMVEGKSWHWIRKLQAWGLSQ